MINRQKIGLKFEKFVSNLPSNQCKILSFSWILHGLEMRIHISLV